MTVSVNTHIRAGSARFTLPTHAVCRRDGTHSCFLKLGIAAVLLLAVLCMAAPAAAEGGTTGNLTWDLTDGTLTISGEGAMPDYSYPDYGPWYSYRSSITSVVIGMGVTSIGDSAFSGCSGLTSVVIPSSVTSIGKGAFQQCKNLASIDIPSSVMSIGEDVFESCINLTSIDIPSGVTGIGDGAFAGCIGLTCVTFAEGSLLTDIGIGAFERCSCLASIVIPSNVTNIGYGVFSWCSNLSFINVEDGNLNYQDIDGVLFSKDGTLLYNYPGGKSAVSYEIPSVVTEIGLGAFAGCSHLSSIEIPSGVTEISVAVFSDCSGLISIEIPSGVTEIGYYAFAGCSRLLSIEIPSGITSVSDGAFSGCSSLTSITFAEDSLLTSIGEEVFRECYSLSSIELPSSVTDIGESAFYGCSNLTSIEIPSGVTEIGDSAFSHCSNLTSVVIPSNVTDIGGNAFSDCSNLTSVVIPSGVTDIGENAFSSLAENSIIYCADASRLSGTYSTSKTALAVNNSNGSYTFSSSVTNLTLSKENAPAGIIYGGWFAESSFTTPVTSIAAGENPTLWLKIRSGYSITVISAEGGTASASKTSSPAGNLITLTASANSGYIFKEWQVIKGGVTVTNNRFIMPACDIEIKAVFEEGEPSDAMYLSSGWNFVSVPKKLAASYDTAAELFGSVNTSGKAVLFYNAETKLWEQVTGETVIEPLNAYWIYSVEKNTISPEFDKGAFVPAVKKVYEGWNVVGLSAEEPMTAAAVFNNIAWRTYLPWNAAEQKYYTAIIKGGSGKYSDENMVYLWKGGWVYMDSDATFIGYA